MQVCLYIQKFSVLKCGENFKNLIFDPRFFPLFLCFSEFGTASVSIIIDNSRVMLLFFMEVSKNRKFNYFLIFIRKYSVDVYLLLVPILRVYFCPPICLSEYFYYEQKFLIPVYIFKNQRIFFKKKISSYTLYVFIEIPYSNAIRTHKKIIS